MVVNGSLAKNGKSSVSREASEKEVRSAKGSEEVQSGKQGGIGSGGRRWGRVELECVRTSGGEGGDRDRASGCAVDGVARRHRVEGMGG